MSLLNNLLSRNITRVGLHVGLRVNSQCLQSFPQSPLHPQTPLVITETICPHPRIDANETTPVMKTSLILLPLARNANKSKYNKWRGTVEHRFISMLYSYKDNRVNLINVNLTIQNILSGLNTVEPIRHWCAARMSRRRSDVAQMCECALRSAHEFNGERLGAHSIQRSVYNLMTMNVILSFP